MNIFKNTTFTWWQLSIFKVAVFFIGVACGIYWNVQLNNYLMLFVAIGIIFSIYVGYVWSKNK